MTAIKKASFCHITPRIRDLFVRLPIKLCMWGEDRARCQILWGKIHVKLEVWGKVSSEHVYRTNRLSCTSNLHWDCQPFTLFFFFLAKAGNLKSVAKSSNSYEHNVQIVYVVWPLLDHVITDDSMSLTSLLTCVLLFIKVQYKGSANRCHNFSITI